MLKHHADFAKVTLAIPPSDENLYADGKAHRQGGEDEVIQARHHGGTQLDGAEMTQECGVGEGDDGLRQVTQHDGVRYAPDFAVGDARFNHAAKLRILWDTLRVEIVQKSFQNLSYLIIIGFE